jgi:hypothetical protein
MTEELKQTVSGESTSEGGLPQPNFTEQIPASSTSELKSDQQVAFSPEQEAYLEKVFERKLQSVKDKRFDALEKKETKMTEVLTKIKEMGIKLTPELEQEFQVKDAVRNALAEIGVTPVADKSMSKAGVSGADKFNVVDELKAFELDTNNPDVMKLVDGLPKGVFRNPDHFRAEAAKLAVRIAKQSTTTSSDTMTNAPVVGAAITKMSSEEQEKAWAKLGSLLSAPTENAAEIAALKKALGA